MHAPGSKTAASQPGTSGGAAASDTVTAPRSDQQLIDATLAGDTEAYGELVRRHQDRLYHALAHTLDSTEDARDLVQEALVQAFVKLDTFQRAAAFYTWLYRIAFNLAASRRRKRRPRVSIDELREQSGVDPAATSDPPERRLDREEESRRVRLAMAALPEDQRQILVLREMEDCSYEQLSEMLGVPIGTVRSRLFRARMALRERLQASDTV